MSAVASAFCRISESLVGKKVGKLLSADWLTVAVAPAAFCSMIELLSPYPPPWVTFATASAVWVTSELLKMPDWPIVAEPSDWLITERFSSPDWVTPAIAEPVWVIREKFARTASPPAWSRPPAPRCLVGNWFPTWVCETVAEAPAPDWLIVESFSLPFCVTVAEIGRPF